ncbi:MAG: TonB-dependent receptor [Chitinophagaceae bacterium]|nr:TonB-dependent receptor [Chitinophagaceae bacterium]
MIKFLFAGLLFIASASIAQVPGGAGRSPGGNNQNMNAGHFYGKIVDDKTGRGIEAATVQLRGTRFDTATKKSREVILATVLSQPNGDFSLENLPVMGSQTLRITIIGYKDYEQKVSFDLKRPSGETAPGQDRMAQMLSMVDKDLGNIKLSSNDASLGNVTVTATTAMLQLGVDRKIFTVDKNLVSTGQTATEVMKQIPSLNVDIDGNVTMRNATPQLFIDGRPTTLTMDQIPADIIDKVELISNPSAKFDASGGNAGILNIVLKKNKKTGYNGGIRAGLDSRAKVNLGGDLNLRQNKINISLSGNYNQRLSKGTGITDRHNLIPAVSHTYQRDSTINDGYFGFFRAGLDYFIDNRNTISVAANYNRGQFKSDNYQILDTSVNTNSKQDSLVTELNRYAHSLGVFKNFGSQLSFRHNFAKNGHDITADLNYNSSSNDNNAVYTNKFIDNKGGTKYHPVLQNILGNGTNKFFTIQADYENPVTDFTKLEAGVRAAIRDFDNTSNNYYDSTGNGYLFNTSASSHYKYTDKVYAAYVTYSFKVNKWSLQTGLRAESSNYNGTQLSKTIGGKDSSFNVKYPLSLFPSIFSTYKIDDKQDMQVNYTRRINRPNFFQLIPFIDYSDPQNLSVGNPGLRPEFTNSFEVSYNNNYKRGSNFLLSAYYKYNTDLITRYTYRASNPLKTGDSTFFSTFQNANSSTTYGLELTNRIAVTKFWDNTINLNLYNSKINGSNIQSGLTNQRVSWFVKMNNNFKLPKNYSIQFSGDYQAKTVLPQSGGGDGRRGGGGGGGGGMFFGGGNAGTTQGYINPRYGFDLAFRKDWTWKGGNTGSLTLSVNDVFKTQKFSTYTVTPYYTQESERRRDPQIVRLNFSYRFGKFDATLFKRKNNKTEQGGQDMPGTSF